MVLLPLAILGGTALAGAAAVWLAGHHGSAGVEDPSQSRATWVAIATVLIVAGLVALVLWRLGVFGGGAR